MNYELMHSLWLSFLIDSWKTMPNSIITCFYNSYYAEMTFMALWCKIIILPLDIQNYYEFIFKRILWLPNLFHNLTTNYVWNNYDSSKATKFRKLVTWATDLEIQIRKYRYESRNSSFEMLPLHAPFNNRQQWQRQIRLLT